MAGFPIKYVARKIRDNGKTVAYFVSKAHLFEEGKKYNSDGSVNEWYEIDFVTQIYGEGYDIENSPAIKKYYHNKVFTSFQECADYVDALNRKLWKDEIQNLMPHEIDKKREEYKKYFSFASKMKCKYTLIELDKQNSI